MIKQFQMNPMIRDPFDDCLILSLDIPTHFNLNSIQTHQDYLTQQELLILEIRTQLQQLLNIDTPPTNPPTEPNEYQILKHKLIDIRNKITQSTQLNTIRRFDLMSKFKYMIFRTNRKITYDLRWHKKI